MQPKMAIEVRNEEMAKKKAEKIIVGSSCKSLSSKMYNFGIEM